VLRNNGGNDLSVAADGTFIFTTALASGAGYAVTVQTQPAAPTQECVVANDTGTVAAANVTNVTVSCTTRSFRIAGSVAGIAGAGLQLRDVAGTVVPISGNGAFEFPGLVLSGTPYFVSVVSQPNTPTQYCAIANPAGLVGGADTAIDVLCNSGTARFVYVPDFVATGIYGIDVDGTGMLSSIGGSPFPTGASPAGIVTTPSGAFLYVRNADGTVSGYSVNAATGALSALAGSPFTVTGQANSLLQTALDPSGRFLYVLTSGTSVIHAFAVADTGELIPISGSPFPAQFATGWLGFDPLGRFLYGVSNTVGASAYRIAAATGALTDVGTPVAGATGVPRGVVHPGGTLLYVAHETSNSVDAYTIDTATGQLQSAGSVSAPSNQQTAPRMDALGRFLYVPSAGGGVAGFAISQGTGVLSAINGSPVLAGSNVGQIDIDPAGRFLYAPLRQGDTVAAFQINPTTGELSQIVGAPYPLGPNSSPTAVRVDASGASLFVAAFGSDLVWRFTIDGTTGELTFADNEPTGTNAASLTLVGTQ
jgi:6-phosphogluconolactonase (cycloisomerase 2 family)